MDAKRTNKALKPKLIKIADKLLRQGSPVSFQDVGTVFEREFPELLVASDKNSSFTKKSYYISLKHAIDDIQTLLEKKGQSLIIDGNRRHRTFTYPEGVRLVQELSKKETQEKKNDVRQLLNYVVEMAKGGVLMIDEAYLLNSEHKSDPAKLIIPLLMDILANEQKRDIAIILCGYKEPMNKLLDTNPGLASRFPNRYEFQDFTIDELIEITRRRIREHNYRLTKAAWAKYKTLLSEAYAMRDPNTWGNARYVANLLEHIYMVHAKRCMKQIPPFNRFFTITPADIQPIDTPKPRPRIGF